MLRVDGPLPVFRGQVSQVSAAQIQMKPQIAERRLTTEFTEARRRDVSHESHE